MGSTYAWIFSLKALLLSAGVVSIAAVLRSSVPAILDFSATQLPLVWSAFKPPYLYVILNAIIITIVASSRFHDPSPPPPPQSKLPIDPHDVFHCEVKVLPPEFSAPEAIPVVYREVINEEIVIPEAKIQNPLVVNTSAPIFAEAVAKSTWIPPARMDSSEVRLLEQLSSSEEEKPLVSSRFAHRKPLRCNPEGGRALKVARAKRHETLEQTWKMITEGRPMPLTRHLKKLDTWENHDRQINTDPPSPVKKSETFKDRANRNPPPPLSRVGGLEMAGQGKLKKEPSLSQDELNRRVEAFINKFNEDMRLQRQESFNQFKEMINRGSQY